MTNAVNSLKNKLKSQIGKVKHHVSDKAHNAKENAAKKYDSGVGKIQSTTLADKMADMSEGLTKRNEEELLKNKDSTFRKIRSVLVKGTVLITPFIIGIPVKMIDDAIQRNVDLKNAEEYNNVYERELLWTEKEIAKRRKEGKDVKDLVKYRESVKKAKIKTDRYIKQLEADKEKQEKAEKATKEALAVKSNYNSLTAMEKFMFIQPDHFESQDAFDTACMESFMDLMYEAATKHKYPNMKEVSKEAASEPAPEPSIDTESRKTAFIVTEGFLGRSIVNDRALGRSVRSSCTSGGKMLFNNGTYDKVTLFSFDYRKNFGGRVTEATIRPVNERLRNMVNTLNDKLGKTGCSVVMEGTELEPMLILKEESVTKHVENGVRSAVHTARDAVPNESPIKKAERATEPLDNAVNDVIDSFRNAMQHDTKQNIVDGKYRFKLVRIIAKCIAYNGLYVLVGPAVAAIAFLGKMAYDKHIDTNERNKIVHDLQTEMEITEEKIKDAESKGDNENKYKLMRIRKALDKEIARIKLHNDK